jgi:hypothetical protein
VGSEKCGNKENVLEPLGRPTIKWEEDMKNNLRKWNCGYELSLSS